ncbi:MAG TPA: TRAP transporter small permease [Sulfuricaulis sp.]|nr:TRAP transporter small permease [Sulfuricaulis sp.]
MELFIRSVRSLSVFFGIVAAASLVAAILVVCQMVVMRYFLQASTVWQTEFVTFSIVGATFIGSPYVLLTKGHVNVDLLPLYLSQRIRKALALFVSVLAFLVCVVLAWTGWKYFHEAWAGGWRTDTVWSLPLWIPILPLPLGMALLSLQYAADICCLATDREPPFGIQPKEEGE